MVNNKISFPLLLTVLLLTAGTFWGSVAGIRQDFLIPPSAIQLETGNSYTTVLPTSFYWLFRTLTDSPADPDQAQTELFENAKALGPAHSMHDDIRNEGGGRFSHWGRALYFSSSDNRDPRANHRTYKATVSATLPIWVPVLCGLFLSLCLYANREIVDTFLLRTAGGLGRMTALRPLLIPIVLLLITVVVRVPYFVDSVLDWDESSYILMGDDVLSGNLPYVSLWANQPPLVYFHYALFLLLFGRTIPSVRFAGFLCVFISAFLLYRLATKMYSTTVGFWLAVIYIILVTAVGGEATMSEHLVLIPLLVSLEMFLFSPVSYKKSFVLGFLSGFMTLTRTNMAFFALTLGLLLVWPELKRDRKSFLFRASAFAAGSLVPIGIVSAIYWANNSFPLLVKSFFLAPVAFVSRNPDTLLTKTWAFLVMIFDELFFPAGLALLSLSALGIAIILYRNERSLPAESRRLIFLPLLAVPICFSILLWGTSYEHYLILVFPILILIGGAALAFMLQSRLRKAVLVGLFFMLLWDIRDPVQDLLKIGRDRLAGRPVAAADTGYLLADYLNRRDVAGKYVYFLEYHIGYFLTGAKIPTRYAHPAAICREAYVESIDGENTTPEETLQRILAHRPVWIIRKETVWYFDQLCPRNNELLQRDLDKNYTIETKIGDVYIYKQKHST